MKQELAVPTVAEINQRDSWLAMAIMGLGQALMTFNISALPVSMSGIVTSFSVAPTTVGTVMVVHSLSIAALVMLGAKLGQIFGSRNVFQAMSAVFVVAVMMLRIAPNIFVVLAAQTIAGLAASVVVPSLVVRIANSYKGKQQVQALGLLGGIQALAGMLGFFVAGSLETLASWRVTFAILVPLSLAAVFLGRHLAPVDKLPEVKIDLLGVVLAASAIVLISLGFNNLHRWDVLLAKPTHCSISAVYRPRP